MTGIRSSIKSMQTRKRHCCGSIVSLNISLVVRTRNIASGNIFQKLLLFFSRIIFFAATNSTRLSAEETKLYRIQESGGLHFLN